ncbi:uncharacterized protein LOC142504432 [Primulina tabacum]|uniref:uncharacterized protein LOC142504432 n=1 Tax=Primulina tabacum TaxID=48773 RepID=UPI003F5A2048
MQSKIGEPLGDWDNEATVNELINQGAWDVNLISNRFNPFVAGEILKIPILPTGECDSLFWRFNAKGKYIVCDGCRFQRGLFSPPEHQSEHHIESWWEFIWSLSVPPKVLVFWWSISHDCIFTNPNMFRHHVPVSESCCLCNYPMDSTCHALFFCAAIKHLWKNSPFAHILKGAIQTSSLEICMWLKIHLSKEEFENIVFWSSAMICDFIKAQKKENIVIQAELGNPEKK